MSLPTSYSAKVTVQASTASVKEGTVAKLTVLGDPDAQIPYVVIGLAPEDITNGSINGRVSLDDLGVGTINIGIVADGITEGTETLIVNAGNSFAIMSVEDTSRAETTYFIEAIDGVVEEGKVASFLISAKNAAPGTKLPYTLSGKGFDLKDVSNGKLSGSVALGVDSTAIITVPIKADATTEGDEELTLTLTGRDAASTITIDDTSTDAVVAASYTVWAAEAAVEEGGDAEFLIETSPTQAGKSLRWTITGVSASDVVDKKLSGTATIDSDGTATIVIRTAMDALTEGNETLTLTINGQTASAALLDNRTIRVASVVPNTDTQGAWALYRLGNGAAAVAEAGLSEGDELIDYVPLRASPSKNYVLPKTVAGLISYEDGSFGLLSRSGASYSEQRFSEAGIAKGIAIKLTTSQLLAKESETGTDLNGDGFAGDAVVAILDDDGDPTQSEYSLYRSTSGAIAIAQSDLTEGDELIDPLMLMASKGRPLVLKPTQSVLGLAQTVASDWEVLSRTGSTLSVQVFDAQTGLAKGKSLTLRSGDLFLKEVQFGLDLTGDGEIGSSTGSSSGSGGSGGGQTTAAGSGTNKVIIQTAGSKDLTSRDVSSIGAPSSVHQVLAVGATGTPGTNLNIDDAQSTNSLGKPLVIGALSTDKKMADGKEADRVLSANKLPFPGIFAGIGSGQQGTVNINDAEIYFTGGKLSSYLLEQFGENADSELGRAVIAGLAAGFSAESKGVINITDSHLHFQRNVDPTDLNSSNSDVVVSLLLLGTTGTGSGTANLRNSTLELKATDNGINVGESGATGKMLVDRSHILLAGQHSINEIAAGRDEFASSSLNVGSEGQSTGTMEIVNSSTVRLKGLSADFGIGNQSGRGIVKIDNSRIELIAERSMEPLLRATNPLTIEQYSPSWSGAYLVIGYDQDDGSAKTNSTSNGSFDIANNSLVIVRGPHAGIEVGGSGTKSSGELTISDSVVEVAGSGAIKLPGKTGASDEDYLAAGINSNGDLNVGYFTFINIGGSGWKDFGGRGELNVRNGAELKLYGYDITSGDTVLSATNASLSVGNWGSKASINIEGGSRVSVAGYVRLGIGQDMAQTAFSTDSGLANVSNYSMANIDDGDLRAYSYNSNVDRQGGKSPLTNYAMYTVLGSQGTLTANQFGFYKNSQIIGSGSMVLDDVFSNSTVSLHSDIETSKTHMVKDAGSDGFMVIDEAELLIGDGFNFDNLARRPGFGTLTMKDETGSEYRGSLTVEDSTLVFDISRGQSDKLVVEGFDYCSMNRNNFVVSGSGLQRGERYVLIDFKLNPEGFSGDLEQLLNVKLIGVKGELSYDAAAMDVVFTVQ